MLTRDSRESLKEVIDRFPPPPSKYSINVWTGTRVPVNTGVPPSTSGEEVMRGVAVAIVHKDTGHRLIYKRLADC